mmetsp:Transcript_4752/g.6994  ORF Transcript_4752/g.6994 Transcript_4752/m.6994 type:complete len:188 (+) Transcript_4752:771-1334(+)
MSNSMNIESLRSSLGATFWDGTMKQQIQGCKSKITIAANNNTGDEDCNGNGSGSGSGTSSGNEVLPLLNDTVGELSTSSSSSADKDIGNLCTIYSTWNYFSPEMINASTENAPSIGTTKSSSSSFDSTQLRIEELQYNIDELQKSLMDPSCTRDRDDMESEIKQMKNEIGFLNRERRMAKFKRLLPF